MRTLICAVVFAVLCSTGALIANPSPSHPGDSADAPFGSRQAPPVEDQTEGATVINLDSGTFHASIQEAVDNASPGDTLEVIPGILTEGQVFIDRDLTLQGSCCNETVLAGVDTGDSGDDRAWFLVDTGVDLTVRGLRFDGNGKQIYQAFRHKGTGVFENVTFDDIQYEVSGPAYQGTAIAAIGDDVDVFGCIFTDIGRVGVLYFGTGITGSYYDDNFYAGKGTGNWLDYAVEVSSGAVVEMYNNWIFGNRGVATTGGATSAGVFSTTAFGAGTDLLMYATALLDNSVGLQVGSSGSGDVSMVVADFNRIVGNDIGIDSHSPVVAGLPNWWGCNAGPDMIGCDTTSGTFPADVDPWLTFSIRADPTMITPVQTSDIQADFFTDSAGNDTSLIAYIPDGTPVDFTATLGDITPESKFTIDSYALATFTPTVSSGIADISATTDNETVTVQVIIEVPGTPGPLVINEIDYDNLGSDTAEFVELYNDSSATIDLSTYEVQAINGSVPVGTNPIAETYKLTGSIAAGDFYVVCQSIASTPECDQEETGMSLQNGRTDAIALVESATGTIIDTVSYEGDAIAPYTETAGINPADLNTMVFFGISRLLDGVDTDDNSADFIQACITPGTANTTDNSSCPDPAAPPGEIFRDDFESGTTYVWSYSL
ncbi:MAG: lamin tail domain-containing protein [Acidobacteriota bacterium]